MKAFLEFVAEDIIRKYGTDLSRIAVVFPNKRASLFLNDALMRRCDRPLWSPSYITISDLFRRRSSLQVADPIKLVCELHRVYTGITGFDETLDHFYGWGQLLISDFDDIDKNMAPADKIFANLRDIRELDDISYLNEEQKAVIRKFFSNFSDDQDTILKERFLRLWSRMGDIYHAFNQRLAEQGLAYEGALYRKVTEEAATDFEREHYLFVGFNLLQQVERRLFSQIKAQGKAHFYWDFDRYYMRSEAGHFISQNLHDFPNELDSGDNDIYNNFQRPKNIQLVSAPTEDIQARYVSNWIGEGSRAIDGRKTAIVLCNEGLLQTVVHCLPSTVKSVNITTGYPLQQTPVASLIQRMLRDHTIDQVIGKVKEMAKEQQVANDPLATESFFRAYTLLNRIKSFIDNGDIPAQSTLLIAALINQLIQQTSIPFHGEPAVGLQIMGVLETRNLDFDHVLLLSTNEGNMPRGITDSSFIPYSLRRAFGLTTSDHKAAIYAYYFNRLLSRASDVTVVYSNATVDGQACEMSRFMLQLLVEDSHHTIVRNTLQTGQVTLSHHPSPIQKSDFVMDILRHRFGITNSDGPLLTPTAINRYMRCPLQFYFCYVEGLREPNDTEDGVIDNRIFGNIFHNAAQILYERLMQQSPRILAADLERLLKSRIDIERAVDEAFAQEFSNDAPQGGLAVINREVIIHYVRQLVTIDLRLAPFTILGLEQDVTRQMPIRSLGITTTIGGRADRIDLICNNDNEQIRVVDYKTGTHRLQPLKTVDDIFDETQLRNHNDYYLQAILYARIVRSRQQQPVAPALLFIQHAAAEDFNPILKFGSEYINDVATTDGDRFVQLLMQKVNEIFDPALPLTPTADTERCCNCPYAHLCGL